MTLAINRRSWLDQSWEEGFKCSGCHLVELLSMSRCRRRLWICQSLTSSSEILLSQSYRRIQHFQHRKQIKQNEKKIYWSSLFFPLLLCHRLHSAHIWALLDSVISLPSKNSFFQTLTTCSALITLYVRGCWGLDATHPGILWLHPFTTLCQVFSVSPVQMYTRPTDPTSPSGGQT